MYLKDGFLFSDYDKKHSIIFPEEKIFEAVNYINNNNIEHVVIMPPTYNLSNIDFLKNCNKVKEVNINSLSVSDFTALYSLERLKTLYVSYEPKGVLDLSLLHKLEHFAISWNNKIKGLEECTNLKRLKIRKYKTSSNNLDGLSTLKKLTELEISQSTITSLKGCEELIDLERLELNYLHKLESICDICSNQNTLKELRINSCKKIENHECIPCLKELEWLSLTECGKIKSINFVKKMSKLKSCVFLGTNVIDGDLSPCIGLDYVAFNNKKHYSHNFEFFDRMNKKCD